MRRNHEVLRNTTLVGLMCWAMAPAMAHAQASANPGSAPPTPAGVVNINTATPAQLQLLPGVGLKKANQIVSYRQTHPFKESRDLVHVRGIGPKQFATLRPYVAVSGQTTLSGKVPGKAPGARGSKAQR